MNAVLPLVMLMMAAVVGPLMALPRAMPTGSGPVLVIAPPWIDPLAVVRAARGVPVGPQEAPMAVFATARDTGFVDALHRAGAWAVLDGDTLAAICGVDL